MTATAEVQSGLEGVVAFATEIAEPDRAGGALRYRGVDIEEIVGNLPFGQVWGLLVDGQPLGETPAACLRVNVGEHRIQLQQDGERSPERLVRVGEQHTAENPVRLSYDFRSQQFGH